LKEILNIFGYHYSLSLREGIKGISAKLFLPWRDKKRNIEHRMVNEGKDETLNPGYIRKPLNHEPLNP
jgi:hypothetical protein